MCSGHCGVVRFANCGGRSRKRDETQRGDRKAERERAFFVAPNCNLSTAPFVRKFKEKEKDNTCKQRCPLIMKHGK